MPLRYFKPDILIGTRCEHCGAQGRETLERLYSDLKLTCSACGHEHTAQRNHLRQSIDDTESVLARLPAWPLDLLMKLRRWRKGKHENPPQ